MMGHEFSDSRAPAAPDRTGVLTFRDAVERERNARQIGPAHEVRPLRIYVSGPMTGLPHNNVPAFMAAGLQLAGFGLMPINPAALDHSGHDQKWASFMRVDIKALMDCDGVAMLPGWERSKGARIEENLAAALGMDVRPLSGWLNTDHFRDAAQMVGRHRPAASSPIQGVAVCALSHIGACETSSADSEGGEPV
jgi:hypothetical protein